MGGQITERENNKQKTRKYFTLQWHVTAKCPNHCAHCYLQESEGYYSELENELCFGKCLEIIDDFHQMTEAWDVRGRINFTGGDPLLKPEIFDLIKYARDRDIVIGILGNPEQLDIKTVSKLKKLDVRHYQMSIDGMEKTHDSFRQKGSFKRTLNGIRVLNQIGVVTMVMFTVSKQNMNELIPVINLAAAEEVSMFDFARLVPIGNGKQFAGDLIEPDKYRELLFSVLKEYERLSVNGCKTRFGRKDHLWKLLYQELGLLPLSAKDKKTIFRGCAIGMQLIVVAADGTVYPCRRLPEKIGEVPEQSLRDIFINSQELNKMRQLERMEKCSKCDLFQYCRGCPAVAFGATGNYFAPDPQCWKKI